MARTKKLRNVRRSPSYTGLQPIGAQTLKLAEVRIHFEEYEAIKLCDYELLSQASAAVVMGISRPTFTRIYETARRKMARVLVEPCRMIIEGGNSIVKSSWQHCPDCRLGYTSLEPGSLCPLCGKKEAGVQASARIAFALEHDRGNSLIDEHFGRCAWFGIMEPGDGEITFLKNPNPQQADKAGVNSAEMLSEMGVSLVVAGRFGSKVMDVFDSRTIRMLVPELPRQMEELMNLITK
jgi:predicted DNA-binding protein (UPF0251 family)/predicted Fe-Mo cluster-binding NifX family protein